MTAATATPAIQPHNEKPASVWNSGGAGYEGISRGIADSIEHAVLRLDPEPGGRRDSWHGAGRAWSASTSGRT